MRDLKEVLKELEEAEKEYERKCKELGIEESKKKKDKEGIRET